MKGENQPIPPILRASSDLNMGWKPGKIKRGRLGGGWLSLILADLLL
jgi:hypothetical protein